MTQRRRGKGRMGGVSNRQVRPIQLRKAPLNPNQVLKKAPKKITMSVEKEVVKQLIKGPSELKQAVQSAVNLVPNNPQVKKFKSIVKKANKMESSILKKILKKEGQLKSLQDLLKKCRNCK